MKAGKHGIKASTSVRWLRFDSINCLQNDKIVKLACFNFPESKVAPSDILFCPNSYLKLKDIQFTVIKNREKQQIKCLAYLLDK